jgi:5,10-methylenetetrahydromethanopterin reductase
MRIGLSFDATQPPAQMVDQIVQAEQDGFDSCWMLHIFACDPLVLIAMAGARTSRIELGTSVTPIYGRHPFALAQEALTAQSATNGRLALGIGLSHQIVVENMWGLSYDKPAMYMREYLRVLNPLLQGQPASYAGERFRVNAGLQVPGATKPALLLAALAPAMLRLAGEQADGTITWMTGVKAIETHIVPRITKAAQEAGRAAPRIAVGLPVAVTNDVVAARERASQIYHVYGQLPNYQRVLARGGAKGPGDIAILGDEKDVERQIRALASAGATDFAAVLFPAGDDAAASMARTRQVVHSLIGKV